MKRLKFQILTHLMTRSKSGLKNFKISKDWTILISEYKTENKAGKKINIIVVPVNIILAMGIIQ